MSQFIIHNDEAESVVSIVASGTVTADRCYTRL